MKGLSFEEALNRWSRPGKYAAALELKEPWSRGELRIRGSAERNRPYQLAREELEDGLFELIRSGEVVLSADNPLGEADRPRVLVDPGVYVDQALAYHPVGACIRGPNLELRNVEFFSGNRVPPELEGALYAAPKVITSDTSAPVSPVAGSVGLDRFRHDPTYEHVWIGDQEFSLTETQAEIICELHRAAVGGQPWVKLEKLRDAVKFDSETLHQLFKRMPDWRALIRSDKRGHYRINI